MTEGKTRVHGQEENKENSKEKEARRVKDRNYLHVILGHTLWKR